MGIASDFILIIVAGLLGGLVARALRLPLLVGYVAAGVLVGPYTAGPTVGNIHELELLAEIGVALLLFSLGLEISLRDLKLVRNIALIGGPIQIVVTLAVAAFAATKLLGMPVTEAVWLGAMISVSSTMVVLKTLSSTGMTNTLASRVMIGLLVLQDLAVIPMLIILPQLNNLENIVPKLARAVGFAAVSLFAVVLLGTKLLPWLLKRVLAWGSRELFLVAVVATGVGVGYATYALGLSFALGAFVAGIILSESEFSHQALSDVVPLRDIFGLLFFVTVGMLFDPRFVATHAVEIVLTVVAIFIGKAIIVAILTRAFGYGNMAPWIVGLGLSQIGEFSFVLARTGLGLQAISKTTYDLALTCTIVTMALSPLVSTIALPLGRAWRVRLKPSGPLKPIELPKETFQGHVVVAGYGRSGRSAARVLQATGIQLVVVDSNYSVFGDIAAAGLPGIWGDITSEEILHAASIQNARVLLLAVPDRNSVHLSVERARHLNPHLVVIARGSRASDIAALRSLAVDAAVVPEFEAGVEMVRQTLLRYEFNDEVAQGVVAMVRKDLYE